MKIKENFGKFLFTVIIICFLTIGFVMNIGVLEKPCKRFSEGTIDFPQWITEVKDAYVAEVAYKESFINLNGLFARLTGRTVYNNVSTLNNGMLDYDTLEDLDMASFANGVTEFNEFLSKQDIPFVYVQAPLKTDLEDKLLPIGIENYGNQNAQELLDALEKNGVITMDLRQKISANPDLVSQYFYRTDHHWNTHGAFVAFGEMMQYLQTAFPDEEFDMTLADASNWHQETYENWFLGTRGKRVGIFFGGVDDLVVYTPNFETDMSCYVPKYHAYFSGTFAEAIIRSQYLDEPDYFNESPYCAYIGGDFPIVHHVNKLATNDLKVLLIKDSFSLPFQSFLSVAVRELDVIDPRHYTESTVAEYVAVSQPDIVIMMTNPSVFGNSIYYKTGSDKAEVHLAQTEMQEIVNNESVFISATENATSRYHVFADRLEPNLKYSVTFQNVDVIKGSVDAVTVALYNATTKKILSCQVFDITNSAGDLSYEWTLVTPESGSDDLRVLIYCGMPSKTAGNQLTYNNVKLYQYKTPTE